MYNYYISERQSQITPTISKKSKIQDRTPNTYRDYLSKRHYERVTRTMIQLHRETPTASSNKPAVKKPVFYFNRSRSHKERVQKSLEQNSLLDTVPRTMKVFSLKDRLKEKQIHKPLRMKPKTTEERIREICQYQKEFLDIPESPTKRQYLKTIQSFKLGMNAFDQQEKIDRSQIAEDLLQKLEVTKPRSLSYLHRRKTVCAIRKL